MAEPPADADPPPERPGAAAAPTITEAQREMLHLLGYSDEDIRKMTAPASPEARSAGVSLMITQAQREALRARGYDDEDIRNMTPAEAHLRLGL